MNSASYKMAPTASTATGNNHSSGERNDGFAPMPMTENLRLQYHHPRVHIGGVTTETETDRDSLASL
ncbi:hypothetical protein ElyMa_000554600 [Elysia marginata]|uniref:Uncharacterized protein n=1 Tax=Elysia marginata TaxID=1093978 RepID=A0AAV4G3W9_9GAST|nr:hypothetical protein ElyMa_000554600 [Elysia marginata]